MSVSLKISQGVYLIVILDFVAQTVADYCASHGHTCSTQEREATDRRWEVNIMPDSRCPAPQRCCGATCCLPDGYQDHYHRGGFEWSVMNMWYFWFIVIFILMSCFGGCGYWRRRQLLLAQHQQNMVHHGHFESFLGMGPGRRYRRTCSTAVTVPVYPYDSSISSAVPAPPPPSAASDTSAHGAFPCPPPYSEVVSKPDVYPPSKDELPPYPGEPVISADDQDPTSVPPQPVSSLTATTEVHVPGLPPYSVTDPSSNQNAASSVSDHSHASPARETTGAQSDNHSVPTSTASRTSEGQNHSSIDSEDSSRGGQVCSEQSVVCSQRVDPSP